MPRSIWSGMVTFGMVSVPVKLYPATDDKTVSFHQLHAADHARVKYQKVCAADGKVLEPEEIVRGYQSSKHEYVVITDEDLEKLPVPTKHTVEIEAFVAANEIDPVYFEKSYYLEPEEAGLKPYSLLLRAMRQAGRLGLARITVRNRERLCVLRPLERGALALETLHWPDEVRLEDAPQVPEALATSKEVALAGTFIEALAEPFDPSAYRDRYREGVLDLIQAKVEGKQVIRAPEAQGPAPTHDLMEALRQSVEATKKHRGREAAESEPARRPARRKKAA